MAGERSLDRRIQVTLDYAVEARPGSKDELLSYIRSKEPTNFVYYWRDRATGESRSKFSVDAMDHVIDLCIKLGLLDFSASRRGVTRDGVLVTDPVRFEAVVGRRVRKYLEDSGIAVERLEDIIGSLLRRKPAVLPTAATIWESVSGSAESLDFDEFRELLTLLGRCQQLRMSQRRLFFPG
jgi:hypothetical protein